MTPFETFSVLVDCLLVIALSFYLINHFGDPDAHA